MKKLTAFLLASFLFLSCPSHASYLNQMPLPVTVTANGEMVISDAEAKVISGRTLLPLRAAAEALDAKVSQSYLFTDKSIFRSIKYPNTLGWRA